MIFESPGCKVKVIEVSPGKRLSYQSHLHREERWTVGRGSAGVTVDGERKVLSIGDSAVIGKGQKHRLDNPGTDMLMIVEIQLGDTLDEDDIVRYEDDFGRTTCGGKITQMPKIG